MWTRLQLAAFALVCAGASFTPLAGAQNPIKIGLGIAQTGPAAAGGKAALLALQMWREEVNTRGGLLGRRVELIAYDDQSSAATTPGIYAKLLDVDKVDLLIAPYGTASTIPIMPLVKRRGLLLMGNFSFQANHAFQHDRWFNNAPWNDAASWCEGFFKLGKSVDAKTVAFLVADQEFAQRLASGAKEIAKKMDLTTVYDQAYAPTTLDFSSMIRAIRAAKPDIVYVMSYPRDSVAIVHAVNEIGVGSSVKLFGGAMVGLQFTEVMESLGSRLNGIVNYHTYVPEQTMDFPGLKGFLALHSKRAAQEKIDPLGYYLSPFSYAIGQMLEQAVTATRSLDHKVLAEYLRSNEMPTIVGPVRYGKDGEWATPRLVMIQFRGIVDKNLEQFRQPGKQVILEPPQVRTGTLAAPFEHARHRAAAQESEAR